MVTPSPPAITRCFCSTAGVIVWRRSSGPATCTAPMAGKTCMLTDTSASAKSYADQAVPVFPVFPPVFPILTLSYTDNAVTVTVGGFDAHVTFAGLAPGYVGLHQGNAIVPSGVSAGPSVPVVVTAAGASRAPVTVAIR